MSKHVFITLLIVHQAVIFLVGTGGYVTLVEYTLPCLISSEPCSVSQDLLCPFWHKLSKGLYADTEDNLDNLF